MLALATLIGNRRLPTRRPRHLPQLRPNSQFRMLRVVYASYDVRRREDLLAGLRFSRLARNAARIVLAASGLWALTVLFVVSVDAADVRQVPSSGPDWLRSQMVTPAQFPGFAVTSDYAYPVSQVIVGTGSYITTIRAAALKAAYVRGFLSYDGSTEIDIRLTEYTNHSFAAQPAPAGPGSRPFRLTNLHADKAEVIEDQAPPGSANLYIEFHRGRVRAEILLQYHGTLHPATVRTLRLTLTKVSNLQFADLLGSPDLRSSAVISLHRLQIRDYVTIVLLAVTFASLISLGASLADRGSRERLRSYLPRRRNMTAAGNRFLGYEPLVATIDVSRQSRRKLWRRRAAVILRAAVLLALFTYFYSRTTTLGEASIFAGIGFVASLAEAVYSRFRKRSGFRVPYGWPASLAGMLGAAASLALIAGGSVLIWLAMIALTTFQSLDGISPRQLDSLALSAVAAGLFCFAMADVPYRIVRRLWMLRAKEILKRDGRPDILMLRSFIDDRLVMRRHHSGQQPVLERLSLRRRSTFEEIVSTTMWQFGPVLAVGEPGTTLPPLGAAREYFTDRNWQDEVAALMNSALLIVVVVGRSQALLWEINKIKSAGALSKTIFVFPPLPRRELSLRMRFLASAMEMDEAALARVTSAGSRLLALQIDQAGTPIAHTSGARDDVAYETALVLAARRAPVPATAVYGVEAAFRRPSHGAARPVMAAPARRARTRRRPLVPRMLALLLAASAAVEIGSHVLAPSAAKPPVSVPGRHLPISAPFGLLTDAGRGRLAGVADNTNRLVVLSDSGRIIWSDRLKVQTREIIATAKYVMVSAQQPNELIAWYLSSAGYVHAWTTGLPSSIGQIAVSGDFVAASLPALDRVIILNLGSGEETGSVHVPAGPSPLAAYEGKVLVGSISGYSISVINPRSAKVVKGLKIGVSPSTFLITGDRLLASSVMDGSIVEVRLSQIGTPIRILSRIPISRNGGILSVVSGWLFAATYNSPPQLIQINLTTLRRLRSWNLPSQVYSLIPDGERIYLNLPENYTLSVLDAKS